MQERHRHTFRLTREDFACEEEFLRWKVWSDGDYYGTEKDGRGFYDNGIPLDPHVDKLGAVPSIEEDILVALDAAEASAEQARRTASLIEQIKSCMADNDTCSRPSTDLRRNPAAHVQNNAAEL